MNEINNDINPGSSKYGKKAPIAFFAYRRPRHTKASLESLSRSDGAGESELFIFSDGAKNAEDERGVSEVRELIKGRQWCGKVNIIERDKNLGLANSIISGVTELCDRYGRVIVLEDDLILSPQFLNFMNDALEFYKDMPKVMHISGYMFPVSGRLPETFFYRNTSCWGWATWKRAWEGFEPDVKKLAAGFRDESLRRRFNIEGTMGFYEMLLDQSNNKIDSWAIRWYASVFLAGGLCLHPGRSLVQNIGHDGSGVHCGSTDAYDTEISAQRVVDFTQAIIEDERVVSLMAQFLKTINKHADRKLARILSKLWQLKNLKLR